MKQEQFRKSKVCPIFNLVKDKENKVRVVVGDYIASKAKFDTFEQAEKYLGTKPWEIIVNIIEILLHYEKNTKETANANKENAANAKSN